MDIFGSLSAGEVRLYYHQSVKSASNQSKVSIQAVPIPIIIIIIFIIFYFILPIALWALWHSWDGHLSGAYPPLLE